MNDRADLTAALDALDAGVRELDPAEAPALVVRLAAIMAAAGASLVPGPPPADGTGALLNLQEAARFLGKSPAWLRRKAAGGAFPCARRVGRSWRFPATDLGRYVGRMRQVG